VCAAGYQAADVAVLCKFTFKFNALVECSLVFVADLRTESSRHFALVTHFPPPPRAFVRVLDVLFFAISDTKAVCCLQTNISLHRFRCHVVINPKAILCPVSRKDGSHLYPLKLALTSPTCRSLGA
jgi:hypothetical protein